MMRKTLITICVVLLAAAAQAQSVPTLINYQGKLVDSNGDPLATGNYVLRFSIYDLEEDGTEVWGPQIFGEGSGDEVPVVNGYFNVVLGPEDTQDPPRQIEDAFGTATRYLEVTVGELASAVTLAPRQQVLSAPYALKAENGVPPGTIVPFAGDTVPEGWLLCDGGAAASELTPDLYAAIGTKWGEGSKETKEIAPGKFVLFDFSLPDLRGRFLRGVDGGTGRDPDAASRTPEGTGNPDEAGSIQDDEVADHTHGNGSLHAKFDPHTTTASVVEYSPSGFYFPYFRTGVIGGITYTADSSQTWGHGVKVWGSTDPPGSSYAGETRPVNAYVNYIIKY